MSIKNQNDQSYLGQAWKTTNLADKKPLPDSKQWNSRSLSLKGVRRYSSDSVDFEWIRLHLQWVLASSLSFR